MEKGNRIYWSIEDEEQLSHSDPHDAIEEYLDQIEISMLTEEHTVTVYEFKPMEVDPKFLHPLDVLLEHLDEEYGNPEDYSEPTAKMKEAEAAFVKIVLEEYDVWGCEKTGKFETVNSLVWIREHRPDWLEDKPCAQKDEVVSEPYKEFSDFLHEQLKTQKPSEM